MAGPVADYIAVQQHIANIQTSLNVHGNVLHSLLDDFLASGKQLTDVAWRDTHMLYEWGHEFDHSRSWLEKLGQQMRQAQDALHGGLDSTRDLAFEVRPRISEASRYYEESRRLLDPTSPEFQAARENARAITQRVAEALPRGSTLAVNPGAVAAAEAAVPEAVAVAEANLPRIASAVEANAPRIVAAVEEAVASGAVTIGRLAPQVAAAVEQNAPVIVPTAVATGMAASEMAAAAGAGTAAGAAVTEAAAAVAVTEAAAAVAVTEAAAAGTAAAAAGAGSTAAAGGAAGSWLGPLGIVAGVVIVLAGGWWLANRDSPSPPPENPAITATPENPQLTPTSQPPQITTTSENPQIAAPVSPAAPAAGPTIDGDHSADWSGTWYLKHVPTAQDAHPSHPEDCSARLPATLSITQSATGASFTYAGMPPMVGLINGDHFLVEDRQFGSNGTLIFREGKNVIDGHMYLDGGITEPYTPICNISWLGSKG